MSCTACGRLLLFETKAVNGAPSLAITAYDPEQVGVRSARRHEVRYVGANPRVFKDTKTQAILRKPKDLKPRFEIGCPYCPETVFVGFTAPAIAGVKRWRVRCSNDHIVFVAPSDDGVPSTWWA